MIALLARAARQIKECTTLEYAFRCHTSHHAVKFIVRMKPDELAYWKALTDDTDSLR